MFWPEATQEIHKKTKCWINDWPQLEKILTQVTRAQFRVYDNRVEGTNPIKLKAVQGGSHPQCAEHIEEMDDEILITKFQ